MLKNITKREGGFTLLELLIVIVIIGILALLIIPNITSAPKKARDTQRKTDMRAIQKNLEEYFVSNNVYPATTADLSNGVAPIMKDVPKDPKDLTGNGGIYTYTYTPSAAFDTYTLHACLENAADNGQYVTTDAACTGATKAFTLLNNN